MANKKMAYVLSAAALLTGAGVFASTAWAEGECSASNFDELEACLADENYNSVTTTGTIVVSGEDFNRTLVVNKPVNGAASVNFINIENGANLTLRGNGTITAGRYGATVDGADLTIDGVTINATNPAAYGVYALNNGHVTILSGQVVANYAAFAGNNTTGDMNFYIDGGQLISNGGYPAIYMPGQVDLRMRGGTLTGGIVARMGQIEIEGGTINVQPDPDLTDGIDKNYNSMPSVANEAITLLAGSYKSNNAEHGNDMNVTIRGNNVQLNGDVVLYDLGNTASGYEQNVNVLIEEGRLTGFKTKYTEEEIGFALKSGYTAGYNDAAGRINAEIQGGDFITEPNSEDIIPGHEAEFDEIDGVYRIQPINIDYGMNGWIESDLSREGQLPAFIEFGEKEFLADRKATLDAFVIEDMSDLTLTGEGELLSAVELSMLDRNGQVIEVSDNDLRVYIELDEETYNMLAAYDKLYAVYFNENGVETERFEAELKYEDYTFVADPETGEVEAWTYYWLEFSTPHLSAYGVVGVNNAEGEEAEEASSASTPETGTMTASGASAVNAALVTAVTIGALTSVVSFIALIRRR